MEGALVVPCHARQLTTTAIISFICMNINFRVLQKREERAETGDCWGRVNGRRPLIDL